MKRLFVGLLILAAAFATEVSAKGKKCQAQKARYVVLIGSDGFSSAVVRAHPGAFPNIEKLAALLNQQKHPRRMLQTIILLAKPIPECGDHRRQKP